MFSHVDYFPLVMFFALLSCYGMMNQTTICNTIIQVKSDKQMRGRMVRYVAMAYFGMLPLAAC
jgi:hypothetical protein